MVQANTYATGSLNLINYFTAIYVTCYMEIMGRFKCLASSAYDTAQLAHLPEVCVLPLHLATACREMLRIFGARTTR